MLNELNRALQDMSQEMLIVMVTLMMKRVRCERRVEKKKKESMKD